MRIIKQELEVYFINNGDESLVFNHSFEKGRLVIDFADYGNDFLMLKSALISQNILNNQQIENLIDSERVMRILTQHNNEDLIEKNYFRLGIGDSIKINCKRNW